MQACRAVRFYSFDARVTYVVRADYVASAFVTRWCLDRISQFHIRNISTTRINTNNTEQISFTKMCDLEGKELGLGKGWLRQHMA